MPNVIADSVCQIEALSKTLSMRVAPLESVTTLTGIQGEFGFSDQHMFDIIEPAIWRFINIGPRKGIRAARQIGP